MTVHNITKLVDKTLLNSIKQYLQADKVQITYSEWFNRFGCRAVADHVIDRTKWEYCQRLIENKYGSMLIRDLVACPKIDHENYKRVHTYGRHKAA